MFWFRYFYIVFCLSGWEKHSTYINHVKNTSKSCLFAVRGTSSLINYSQELCIEKNRLQHHESFMYPETVLWPRPLHLHFLTNGYGDRPQEILSAVFCILHTIATPATTPSCLLYTFSRYIKAQNKFFPFAKTFHITASPKKADLHIPYHT